MGHHEGMERLRLLPDVCPAAPLPLKMCDENPYQLPEMSTEDFMSGSHLGNQIQKSNMQITNVTTPANYFHLLRRQVQTPGP